jgi:hypothetical protein
MGAELLDNTLQLHVLVFKLLHTLLKILLIIFMRFWAGILAISKVSNWKCTRMRFDARKLRLLIEEICLIIRVVPDTKSSA